MNNYSWLIFLFNIIFVVPTSALEWFKTTRAGIPDVELETGPTKSGWSLSRENLDQKIIISVYLDAKLHQKIITNYSDGYLISREEFGADDELLSHVEYADDIDGKMRITLFSKNADGTEPEKIFTSLKNNIDWPASRSIEGNNKSWHIIDKNENGRNVREISIEDEEIKEETIYVWDNQDLLLEKRFLSGDTETRSEFNKNGFLAKETFSLNNVVIKEKVYTWKNAKQIAVEETVGKNVIRLEKKWDKDQLIKEIEWINNKKTRETMWSTPEIWIDTLYRNNKPVLRIHWENNIKVKEEIVNAEAEMERRGL